MSRARRVRSLAAAVIGVAAVLLLVSRQIGRTGSEGGSRSRGLQADSGQEATQPGKAGAAAPTTPDLSFYDTLGVTRSGPGGNRSSAGAPMLDADPGDPAPRGAFVVQVLATGNRKQAQAIRDRVALLGVPVRLIEGTVKGKPIYRVRTGRYRERRTAVAWADRISKELGLEPWVLQEAK